MIQWVLADLDHGVRESRVVNVRAHHVHHQALGELAAEPSNGPMQNRARAAWLIAAAVRGHFQCFAQVADELPGEEARLHAVGIRFVAGEPAVAGEGGGDVVRLEGGEGAAVVSGGGVGVDGVLEGEVTLRINGAPQQYTVQATNSLNPPISWTEVGKVTPDASGSATIVDTAATGQRMRFYRVTF